MVGIFRDYLPKLAYDFFSDQICSEGKNGFTSEEAYRIASTFAAAQDQLACYHTLEEMVEAVSAVMQASLNGLHIADAESLAESFAGVVRKENWPFLFDDYRLLRIEDALFTNIEEKAAASILPGADDLDVIFMARLFMNKPLFTADYQKYEKYGVCNAYEAQHMVWWFSGQITLGGGAYTRSTPNFSAKKTWTGLRSNTALLWIAIALGVEEETLDAAYADMNAVKNMGSKCAAVRKHIPFETIYNLASEFLPDRQQVKKLSHAFEGTASVRAKLDSSQLAALTADLEKELLRTPVFDTQNRDSIAACFEPVAYYLLMKHGFAEGDRENIAKETSETLYCMAVKI